MADVACLSVRDITQRRSSNVAPDHHDVPFPETRPYSGCFVDRDLERKFERYHVGLLINVQASRLPFPVLFVVVGAVLGFALDEEQAGVAVAAVALPNIADMFFFSRIVPPKRSALLTAIFVSDQALMILGFAIALALIKNIQLQLLAAAFFISWFNTLRYSAGVNVFYQARHQRFLCFWATACYVVALIVGCDGIQRGIIGLLLAMIIAIVLVLGCVKPEGTVPQRQNFLNLLKMTEQDRKVSAQDRLLSRQKNKLETLERSLNEAQQMVSQIASEGGSALSRYKLSYSDVALGEKVGEGAFGTVYRARWRHRVVAIKQLRATKVTERAVRAFLKEILVMAPLKHPHLVQLLGGCWSDGPDKVCIVLEFCANGNLEDHLQSSFARELTWKDFYYDIVLGVALCMRYLHHELREPLIHRDLKPQNVLLSGDMKSKDFGESREFLPTDEDAKNGDEQDEDADLKELSMTMVGSPIFCAPEILLLRPYGLAADVYSFGMSLLFVTCPCHGESTKFILRQFQGRLPRASAAAGWRPKPPDDLPKVNPKIWSLIQRCTEDNIEKRPTFIEIAEYLNHSYGSTEE